MYDGKLCFGNNKRQYKILTLKENYKNRIAQKII